ncbi:hypothetical protein [Frankia sp. AiPs1]|nr:hypothetical protein [Frankia sp. AiPs1]
MPIILASTQAIAAQARQNFPDLTEEITGQREQNPRASAAPAAPE